ncbi:circularly permuted type 2 ATP-grasp protein [Spongisporangium articulatum]|uniref:Circularly permuted type 2 ATP-grasp protein n=1 Tax=Spongisporangium articulatum TaxID=3362603 RepID=A0ABW8AJB2_9ACTN
MTAAPLEQHPDDGSVLEGYRTRRYAHPELRGADELLDPDGDVRSGWRDLAAAVDLLGTSGLQARIGQVRRLLQDDGVTYAPGDETVFGGWRLDPLPTIVSGPEWDELAAGLAQRGALLDAVLADVYGERRLIREGLLPPEVVYGHSGFLRQCDGILLPGDHQLILAATDLVRRPEGWYALGDRAQAPSGSGYAMQNRRIVSRVMPALYRDTQLRRLRSFFHTLRSALQAVAPRPGEMPRVVILTPGAPSETSFEHAFLSSLLGFPLVEGRDLQVRDEQVWFRSLGRPERVDVVLRRVDGWFCDPLELRGDSRLGVPGLLQAARAGNVSIVNPPGAGVLENGGLVPFLPRLAEVLLDEPLKLPSVPTWWCGHDASRRHVLANLGELVVRPIARGVGRANRFGWELSSRQLAALRARIEAEPHNWSAQERLEMSSTPVATAAGLEPRRLVLRAFAVAGPDGYTLMNGGLGRVGAEVASYDISNQSGASAKDVWVLADSDVDLADLAVVPAPLVQQPGAPELEVLDDVPVAAAATAAVPARVAEDLFWLGRYAERAEDAARLLRVASDLAADHAHAPGSVGHGSMTRMLRALTGVTTTFPGFLGEGAAERLEEPGPELLRLAVDTFLPGSLAHGVRHTIEAAYGVRELLSTDTFLVLSGMERALHELAQREEPELYLQPATSRVLEGLLALSGLAAESMVRDGGWFVMDAGRRIERSLQLVQLLRHALDPQLGGAEPLDGEELVLESVLIAAESVITMRRRVPGRPRAQAVLDLLLVDPDNPRGLAHQLDALDADLAGLEAGLAGSRDLPELDAARALVAGGVVVGEAADDRTALLARLEELSGVLSDLGYAVARTYFARVLPPRPLAVDGRETR